MHLMLVVFASFSFSISLPIYAAPIIDPIGNVNVAAGKSVTLPVTATSPEGRPLTFSALSSTNRMIVEVHTNNPFWKLSVVQAAPANAPGAFQTYFRGAQATVTNVGEMTFMLFRERAPRAVDAMLGLTASGYYTSNTIFHRVIANFVIQGGDPTTNGSGTSAFSFEEELHRRLLFRGNGQLGMASSGKDNLGAQFFITLGPQPNLDLRYTISGQLVRGFDVLNKIGATPTNINSRPLADVIITRASQVPNFNDTVITLTASNLAGVTSTIRVIADDGAGGRTTNTFTATTIANTNGTVPMLSSPPITNRIVAMNGRLTNAISAVDLDGQTLYYDAYHVDDASGVNSSNSVYTTTFTNGVFVIVPNTNYIGPLRYYVAVAEDPFFFTYYDYQQFNVAVGDTPITARSTNWVAKPGVPFANQLLAVFTNGVPNSPAANFSAYVNWGDDSTNVANVTLVAGGTKEVRGSHTYINSGTYPVYVTLQSNLGADATVISTTFVPPELNLTRTGSNNTLRWPAWAIDYKPQSSTNLTASSWTSITNLASLVAFERVVTNSSPASNAFFRLIR